MKFGNLREICLWPHLAVKGLKVKVVVFVIVVVLFFFFVFLLFLVSNHTLLLGQRQPQFTTEVSLTEREGASRLGLCQEQVFKSTCKNSNYQWNKLNQNCETYSTYL